MTFGLPILMERQMKSDALNALADLERSEFYLREGERLAQMRSWSLKSDGTLDYWSPQTFVLFGFDPSQGIPIFAPSVIAFGFGV
jgi:hypothetical protein